ADLPGVAGERVPRLGVGRGVRLHARPGDDRAGEHPIHAGVRSIRRLTTEAQRHREERKEDIMRSNSFWLSLCLCASVVAFPSPARAGDNVSLQAGFGEADIPPAGGGKRVFLAGFGQNRRATEILDPLAVRAVVLRHSGRTVAIACADVVGLFLPSVERVRQELPGFTYVLVSSTHNHHGPDTMGIWGPNPFTNGVDPDYLRRVEAATVRAIRDAEKSLRPVSARIGTVAAPE